MPKHIAGSYLYTLPSGNRVHPFRLIIRDGSIMWKHALLYKNKYLYIPPSESVEAHIVKTAHRLEELNSWLSQDLEPWESLLPDCWYVPDDPELAEGISLYMHHIVHSNEYVLEKLSDHIFPHETLEIRDKSLFFKRC